MAPPGFAAAGGLSFLRPDPDDTGRIVIQRRGLIVVRPEQGVEPLSFGQFRPWRWSVAAAYCYPPERLEAAVAQAACFPYGLCGPPAEVVVPFLRATRSVKFLATYGTIRHGEPTDDFVGLAPPSRPPVATTSRSVSPGLARSKSPRRGVKSEPRQTQFAPEEWSRHPDSRVYNEGERREDDEYYGYSE